MITPTYSSLLNINDSPTRTITGEVNVQTGVDTWQPLTADGQLQSLTVTRIGEHGKFFGFGICQKATVKAIDEGFSQQFLKGAALTTKLGTGAALQRICPTFHINNIQKDEKTNVLTIEAYDALDSATSRVIEDLGLVAPYTLKHVVERIASVLGLTVNITDSAFDTEYANGANFGGTETLRAVLNAIAEVTQTIYYVDHNDNLIFKHLDKTGDPVITVNKANYYELQTALPVTISQIMHVTELGDNVEAGEIYGVCQYVRDNPFWNNRTDLQTLIPAAAERVNGITIVPHTLKWRGNFLTEIGDKISLEGKDGQLSTTYILDDTITYTGGMTETTAWEYVPESDRTTAANPATIGDKINQTFAKVDKVNQQITLQAEAIEENKSGISQLQVSTNQIKANVSSVETRVTEVEEHAESTAAQANTRMDTLEQNVGLKLDREGVEITVENILSEGVDKVVTTSKKYTFDDSGLNVSSKGSSISTTITEDGMRIYRAGTEVLIADNEGVKAEDLHATTYLIIGNTSRLEDRMNRTACYWTGE